ncbi:uncharacterized protein V6R79_019769 [Siganus canaliculatus]
MAALGFCGDWFISICDTKLVAIHSKADREPFVFDCRTAEKKPRNTKEDNSSDGGTSEETGSDKVLAFTTSPSGKLVALTDDNKRLVLFLCEPSWKCLSIRFVVRRCTSLSFTQAEDQLLAADKSGDVYSFSVVEAQAEGELRMGHLSMLLAVVPSHDDKYVITADRDEKIRVSHLRSPYNIQSFCLGHQQFVSALLTPAGHPHWLLSGSGDGTVKLWEYESGRKLQSCNLQGPEVTRTSETEGDQSRTVSRLLVSADTRHVVVQCEGDPTLQFLVLDPEAEEKMVPQSSLVLPHCPLDVTFDLQSRLWVLVDSRDVPLLVCSRTGESWKVQPEDPDLSRVTDALRPHWEALDASSRTSSCFKHLRKVGFDNVTLYLQKKQQRLDEQQLKRTKVKPRDGNKRPKMETSAL